MIEVDPARDPRWDLFVQRHPDGLVYHHSLWLDAIGGESGTRVRGLLCEAADGDVHGVLPFCETRGVPFLQSHPLVGRRFSSLPRTPLAGPLGTSREAVAELVAAAVSRAVAAGAALQVKTLGPTLDDLVPGLVGVAWRPNYRRCLPADPATIRFGSSKNHRSIMWAVRAAERWGLVVRPAESTADLRAWYRLYLRTLRSVPVLPRPFSLFERLRATMEPRGMARLLLAETRTGGTPRVVAGSLILSSGRTSFYAFNGRDERFLHLRPNDAIQWCAIREAALEGREWYDLGEAETGSSLEAFKRKWASCREQLFRYYAPAPAIGAARLTAPMSRPARALWHHLPLGATAAVGAVASRLL